MHPVLFQVGPFTAWTYGLFLAAGLVAGWLVGRAELRRRGHDPALALDITLLGLVIGVAGGKLAFLLTIPPGRLLADPWSYLAPGSGLVWYGTLGAVIASTAVYGRRKGVGALATLDAALPAFVLGSAIGRIGCFFAGCCWGKPTTLPWGIVFADPRAPAPHGVALHPTQLYLALHGFAVFALLQALRKRTRRHGEVLVAGLAAYAVGRFFIEAWRGDAWRGRVAGLATSQFLSLVVLAAAAALYLAVRSRRAASGTTAAGPGEDPS